MSNKMNKLKRDFFHLKKTFYMGKVKLNIKIQQHWKNGFLNSPLNSPIIH